VKAVILRPEARQDALEAFRWYETRSPGLGVEFRCALDATIERIASHPETYREHERGLRHALVRRFPYAVYFRLVDDIVVVVGIIHTRRHPGVAKAR
jgi:plasmid stabilization system protein ParE